MTRTCGECTVCCTVMSVKDTDFDKREYTPCAKLCAAGCSIYANKPSACTSYSCLWLIDNGDTLRDEERPDKSGLLFEMSGIHRDKSAFEKATGIPFLVVREATPGAFEEYRGQKTLRRLSKKALIIRAYQAGKRVAMGPMEKVRVWAEYVTRLGLVRPPESFDRKG